MHVLLLRSRYSCVQISRARGCKKSLVGRADANKFYSFPDIKHFRARDNCLLPKKLTMLPRDFSSQRTVISAEKRPHNSSPRSTNHVARPPCEMYSCSTVMPPSSNCILVNQLCRSPIRFKDNIIGTFYFRTSILDPGIRWA